MKSKDQLLLEEAYNSILLEKWKLMYEHYPQEMVNTYKSAVERLKSSGLKVLSLGITISDEDLFIWNNDDRDVILIDLGPIKLPFYNSTGQGGKERVAAGGWYPIFGVSSRGWFNKGSQTQINNYYGSTLLKAVAQKLDSVLGEKNCGLYLNAPNGEKVSAVLNQDLAPADRKDLVQFYANIANVLSKVKGMYELKLTGSTGDTTARIPLDVGQDIAKHIVGEDNKFFSNPQFQLTKSKKYSNVMWHINHHPEAKNQTFVNGKEVTVTGQTLNDQDVITLGKSAKGKIVVYV